ncbi:MAG: 2OG-Fe(II) oxygenase [Caldilineaceae bacterium]
MQTLLHLLDQVESSGAFAVSGTLPPIPPGLTVQGIGHIGLPLTTQQAQALIAQSEQAPFGRREEAIVDTEVRKNWQIGAETFELTNSQWQAAIQSAADQIGHELGLVDCTISAEPYKLLIYEAGSFFTAHRDTEKIPNMFATLVVNLPAAHQGGELIISHAGQSNRYSFADNSLFESSFVAFYADCYHEVKPVTAQALSRVTTLQRAKARPASRTDLSDPLDRLPQHGRRRATCHCAFGRTDRQTIPHHNLWPCGR